MPEFPEDRFVRSVLEKVSDNAEYVPPYESGATMYVRPFMFGCGDNLGIRPAAQYMYRVFCSPVGSYFKGAMKPVKMLLQNDYDRAASKGTGYYKLGANYAIAMYPHQLAVTSGYADCLYTDPLTQTKIEEAGGANFVGITKDGCVVTPKSDSILPSIARRSLLQIATDYFNMKVEERDIYADQLDDLAEAFICGTAAVLSPICGIQTPSGYHAFCGDQEVGAATRKLYDTLIGIQSGEMEAPQGWIYTLDGE